MSTNYAYLGEQPQEYRSLVKNAMNNDNTIDLYNIKNEHGKFTGYKVNRDGVDGYAYFLLQGDIYEFAKEEVCEASIKETQTIKDVFSINLEKFHNGAFAKRDKNKTITEVEFEFISPKLYKERSRGFAAEVDGVDGFVFQKKILGSFSASQDKMAYYFISGNNVEVTNTFDSRIVLTQEERRQENIRQNKENYDNITSYFDKISLNVEDMPSKLEYANNSSTLLSVNNAFRMVKTYVEKYDKLPFEDIKFENVSTTISNMNKEKLIEEQKRDSVDKYGFYLEQEVDMDNSTFNLKLKNGNHQTISTMRVNNAIYNCDEIETEIYLNEDETRTYEPTVLFINSEDEEEQAVVIENGKTITIEESKFASVYGAFVDKAIGYDEEYDDISSEVEEVSFDGIDADFYEVNFHDFKELTDFFKDEVNLNNELTTELKEAANSLKHNTKKITVK